MSFKDYFPYFGDNEKTNKTADEAEALGLHEDNQEVNANEKKISRREFMQAGIGAAAAVTLGGAIKAHDLLTGDEENPVPRPKNVLDTETDKKNTAEKKENKAENICDHFVRAYEFLASHENDKKEKDFWKDDLFTDKFFIAIQLTESNFKVDAESDKQAYGVMQVREIAIKDVIRILNKLKRNDIYKDYSGPDFNQLEMNKWRNEAKNLEKDLKKKKNDKNTLRLRDLQSLINTQEKDNKPDLDKIVNVIKNDANYNRAIGKTYFTMLFNKEFGYNIGWNEYHKENTKEAQKKLAMAYNCGPTNFENKYAKNDFTDETTEYPKKVFNYIQRLTNIETKLKENGIFPNNEAIMLMARQMSKDGESRYEALNKRLPLIKERSLLDNWPSKKEEYKKLLISSIQ